MFAIKKAVPLQFVQVDVNPDADVPDGVKVQYGAIAWQVWNEKGQQWLNFAPGDYLNVTDLTDVYPVAKAYFETHYDVQQDDA